MKSLLKNKTKLLTLAITFCTFFSYGVSQNINTTKISLNKKNVTLQQIFTTISKVTQFNITYGNNITKDKQVYNVIYKNTSVAKILDELGSKANFSYIVENKDVIIRNQSTQKNTRQDKVIKGKVVDKTGETLPGASIVVKGTSIGINTGLDGTFTLKLPENATTLVVSYLGYIKKEVPITNVLEFTIVLEEASQSLDEVVVTALNIKRGKKTLGYATQKISGSEIAQTAEPNLLSSFSGKIAGAQITNTNGSVGSSSTIVLRGYNSLSGRNQPLFVVDGIPISNEVHQSTRTFGGPSNPNQSGFFGEGQFSGTDGEVQVDYGNAAAEINPQDIQEVQVLKGATASALYGARAANGVILITTKKGRKKNGLGISLTFDTSIQTALKTPEFQTQFGKGSNGLYSFPDLNANSRRNFGPRFSGQNIPQYDPNNPTVPRNIPWINRLGSDPIGDFLETGITHNYNLSITRGNEDGNFRLSFSRLDQKGMVPNTDLERNSLSLNSNYNLSSKFSIGTSFNYINSGSDNRPEIGAKNPSNILFAFLQTGTNESLSDLQNYWEPFQTNVKQATSDRTVNNPYFLAHENLNGNSRNRLFGNFKFNYEITNNLSMQFRTGLDFYRDKRTSKKSFSHFPYTNGFYSEADIFYQENNTDILFTYKKDIKNVSLKVIAGANRLDQRYEELRASTGVDGLVVPGVFNLSNSRSPVIANNFTSHKRINSIYGSITLGLNDYLFLDVTGRNDWSSALPIDNNSFFYPSVSLSGIVSDILDLDLGDQGEYLKTRFSYAEVGNDTDPYQTSSVSINGSSVEGITANTVNETLGNIQLKPENITSYEFGIEGSLFKNRLFFDASVYSIQNTDQIAVVPLATESGFLERTINVPAKIKNQGIELSTTITPIKNDDFQWDLTLNWAKNTNKIEDFQIGESDRITLAERWINLDIVNGGSYGDFYGDYLLKVDENGNLGRVGLQVFRPDGRSEESDDVGSLVAEAKPLIGNANPDWIGGINNSFRYKNFNFSFLFDINKGGNVHSRTFVIGNNFGSLIESTQVFERDSPAAASQAIAEGQTVIPEEHWVVLNGAFLDKTDGFTTPANFAARTQNVYRRYFDNDAIGTFDRTFVKLREVKLAYQFPKSFTDLLSIQDASLTVYGRNLLLWDNVPHIDPEAAGYSGELIGGEFFALPSARTFGFSLTANF